MNEVEINEAGSPIEEPRSNQGNERAWAVEDRSDTAFHIDPTAVVTQLDEVRAQTSELRAQVEELQASSPDSESRQTLRRTVETQAERIDELTDRYESLGEIDDTATRALQRAEIVRTSLQSIRADHDELAEDHTALRADIDEEFGHLRTILEWLIDTTEQNESSIDELRASHESQITELRRLIELKNAALRRGVESAECAYCGTDVELEALPSPRCPQCDRPLRDIERDSTWFGLVESYILTTTDGASNSRANLTSATGFGTAEAGRNEGDESAPDEFGLEGGGNGP